MIHRYADANDIDFWALARIAYDTVPGGVAGSDADQGYHVLFPHEDGGDTAPSSRSVIGQMLYDPETQEAVGILVETPSGLRLRYLVPASGLEPGGPAFRGFQPGAYMLANGQVVAVGSNGFYVGSAVTPQAPSAGSPGLSFGQQQALTEQDFQNQLRFLEAQEKAARERFQYESAANFANEIELLKQRQDFATGEREAGQEFAAGESALSRENQQRLQLLSNLSQLQQQILADKARGRELLATTIGTDPFRSAALAQGRTPVRGTPADIFRGQLTEQVQQPLPQPGSLSIEDLTGAIEQAQGGLGLPTPPVLGFAGGGRLKRGNKAMQVLVGERGPELLTVDNNQVQVTPLRSAAHGATIGRSPLNFQESPFITFSDLNRDGFSFPPPDRPGPTTGGIVAGGTALAPGTSGSRLGGPVRLENVGPDANLSDALAKLAAGGLTIRDIFGMLLDGTITPEEAQILTEKLAAGPPPAPPGGIVRS